MEKQIKKSLLALLVITLLIGNLFFPFLTSAAPGIIFEDGFESGDLSNWNLLFTSTGETLTVVTTDPRHGAYHLDAYCDGSSQGEYARSWKNLGSHYTELYARVYFKVTGNLPNANGRQFTPIVIRDMQDFVNRARLEIYNDAGTNKWRLSGTGATATFGSSDIQLNTWYCLEVGTKFSSTGEGWYKFWLNGNLDIEITGLTNDEVASGLYVGEESTGFAGAIPANHKYVDDVVVSDTYIDCYPNEPSSLGPTNYVNGSWISDTTPTFEFTQSDPDSSDTLRYRIQIDNNSDFSSPVIDYTSDYLTQGATTFTVGQAPGSGTYTQGSQGQTLPEGSYYWQVMSGDQNSHQSSWTKANSGNVAFKLSIAKIYTGVTNTIYSNGTVSYSQQPNSNNLINFNLVPSYGSITLTILTWQTSGEYLKEWTEDASQPGIVTDHTVGDLKPNTSYNILVDNTLFTKKTSDATGEINFTYDGGYSEKTFKIEETPEELAPTGNNTLNLFYFLPLIFLLIGFILLRVRREQFFYLS